MQTLSVSIILGDEGRDHLLPAVLMAVAPIADEFCVVTNATDGSDDLCRQVCADLDKPLTLIRREWTNSYAEQRNASLELCTQDWILVLDADEMMDDGFLAVWPTLELGVMQGGWFPMYHLVRDPEKPDEMLWHQGPWYPDPHCRLFRRDLGLRYQRALHELPCYADGKTWPKKGTAEWPVLPCHQWHFGHARVGLYEKVARRHAEEQAIGMRAPGSHSLREPLSDCVPWVGSYPQGFSWSDLDARE